MSVASRIRDDEAERIVLSGFLKEPDEVLVVAKRHNLGATDLYQAHHQIVFQAIYAMWSANEEMGPFTLYWHLKKRDRLQDLGPDPADWLKKMWYADPTGWWACAWAVEKVKYLSTRRSIVYQSAMLIRDAQKGGRSNEDYRRFLSSVTLAKLGVGTSGGG